MSQTISPVQDDWVEKMKEEITCPICRDIFVEPKQLPGCLHTFCDGCIMRIFKRSSTDTPECPLCRIPLPDLDCIKSDFHMESFVRLYHERMTGKGDEAAIQGTSDQLSTNTLQAMQSVNELEDSIFFDKVAGGARKELQQLVEPLHSKHSKVSSALDKLECTKHEFQAKYDADSLQVQEFFSQLRDTLDKQEENCLQKLDEIRTSSLKILSQQTHDLSDLEAQLDSCKATLSTLIQSKNHSKVVEMEGRVKQATKQLMKTVDVSSQLEPECVSNTTVLFADQEFTTACKSLCHIYSTAHASNCAISYITDHTISVTKPILVSVVLRDVYNNRIVSQSDHFELRSDHGNDFIDSKMVTEATPGVYNISYYPKVRYAHKLRIYHRNSLVAQVDVPLLAVCDYTLTEQRMIETYGSDNRKFNRPCGLALGPNKEIVVSDRGLHQLIIFDANLEFCHVIGYRAHGNVAFNWPSGIVVDGMGCIYVADRKNHCVQKVRLDNGNFISRIGKKGTCNGEFNEPRAVALTHKDHLFVADGLNHRIQVFLNESFIFCFGQHGTGPYEFDLPSGMAFNETEDEIFIADNRNHRIQLFTIRGEYLKTFGDFTNVRDGLSYPQGIHRSKDGHILISCSGNGTILVFKEDGSFVTVIKNSIDRPGDVVTTSQGQLIVANHKGVVISECSTISPCI